MLLHNKLVDQREDLFTAYCYKVFAVGIFNADTMLHTGLAILDRQLSHRGLSKLTKKTYLNIQQHVNLSESYGSAIHSILVDPPLDILNAQGDHP